MTTGRADCQFSTVVLSEYFTSPEGRGEEGRPQFSILVSSGAGGGVLIGSALNGRPSGLVPPCAVPLGMTTRSPGFTLTSLSPSQIVPVPSRMYWISLVLGWLCLPTLQSV